jgi:uncharacterized membrane protein YdjX (TVP38/TMEM64 family)
MDAFWIFAPDSPAHPATVLLPYLVLPLVGFPVTPFLVLLGLRFGSVWGILIMMAIVPIHLVISFWFTRGFAGQWIRTLAAKLGVAIPELAKNRQLGFAVLFMVIPGLGYSIKNLLLPLSGIRFFPYLICGWLIQGIMGIPFVIMGKALIQWDIKLLAVVGMIFLVIFLFKHKIRDIYRVIMKL